MPMPDAPFSEAPNTEALRQERAAVANYRTTRVPNGPASAQVYKELKIPPLTKASSCDGG